MSGLGWGTVALPYTRTPAACGLRKLNSALNVSPSPATLYQYRVAGSRSGSAAACSSGEV